VHHIPERLIGGEIYVSIEHGTVVHSCCCGCGNEVVTPLTPTDWRLIFDGETVSLDPSIGNWGYPCRSHYWITRNQVRWARQWSQDEIDATRALDRKEKKRFFRRRGRATKNDKKKT
jgi:hypothetical protein